MKHIYKRGGSWWFQFTVRGVRYQGAIGNVSRTVAQEFAEKRRLDLLEGKLLQRCKRAPFLGHYDTTTKVFSHAAGKYLDYYRANRKPQSARRTATSLLALTEHFGNKRLDAIEPFLIERYKDDRKIAGKAEATVNRELSCLKNLFNMAIKWGWVRDNPVRSVQLFRENNIRQRFLTREEEQRLLQHCAGNMRLATYLLAALDLGFRAGELSSLCWKNVDFQRRDVTVQSCYTKNGETRRNPMTRRLFEMLTILKGGGKVAADEPVFGPYRYHKAFNTARDAAGLGRDVVFHTMRHTYISRLVMAGADVRTVQELAGHKEIKMTMRYAHLAPEHKHRAVALLDEEVTTKVTTVNETKVVST